MANELDIPIRNDGFWYSMEANNFAKEKSCNIGSIFGLLTSNEIHHL